VPEATAGGGPVPLAARPAIRRARPADLARLGPLYEQAGFRARLAEVVAFARARLDGEVVVAEAGGELVGVAAGAVFGASGWVGGVAVVPDWRRVGLGGALTAAIVEHLAGRGVATMLLHATDLGRPVYERLGFVAEAGYRTLAGPGLPGASPRPPLRPGRAGDLAAVAALDRAATGEDRGRLLAALWPAGGLVAEEAGRPVGFHLASPWRPGGLIVAGDPRAGLALLEAVRRRDGEQVSVSVPAANTLAVQALEAAGFRERYRTTRMRRGPRVPWRPAAQFGALTLFWG
jgi:predicted N-acetyltransferase YhbS